MFADLKSQAEIDLEQRIASAWFWAARIAEGAAFAAIAFAALFLIMGVPK